MPTRQKQVIGAQIIGNDRATLEALRNLTDYAPRNLELNTDSLVQLEAALKLTEREMERLQLLIDTARDRLIEAGHAFHGSIVRARSEVLNQFGDDSPAVRAIGLTRRSDRKRPTRRRTTVSA